MREKKVASKWDEVVEAFKEGREMRGKKVVFGERRMHTWASGAYPREGIRDQVKRENGVLTYYLWDSPIATIDGDILTLDNCGYETKITGERLDAISRAMSVRYNFARPALCHKDGWALYWDMRHDLYPLKINLRTGKFLTKPNLDKQYEHLSRLRDTRKLLRVYDLLKGFGPIPPKSKDKVIEKLVTAKLTEVEG